MKYYNWNRFQAIVGNSSIWREAAGTLRQLAQEHSLEMNEDVHFHEPYMGLQEMPHLLDITYQRTRSL